MHAVKRIVVLAATLVICSGFKLVPEGRIAKGYDILKGRKDFMVSLQDEENPSYHHFCGGSIINEHWILTAGSCLQKRDISAIKIHAGRYDIMNAEASDQTRTVDYYKIHELYIDGEPAYDIALIYTAKPFVWTELVKPIGLPDKNYIPPTYITVSGWGLTNREGKIQHPEVAQRTFVHVISLADCQKMRPKVHETNICTISSAMGSTLCKGDSGGPLTWFQNDAVIVGVIGSWGSSVCVSLHDASVYTRVSAFIDWIEETQKHFELNDVEK